MLSSSCCSGVSPLSLRYVNELVVEVGDGEPVSRGFSSLWMIELGPELVLAPSDVDTSSDSLLAHEAFWFLKGVFLVVWIVVAETTVSWLDTELNGLSSRTVSGIPEIRVIFQNWSWHIGIEAGPAGPVLAGPLFWWFNEIHYNLFKNCVRAYYGQTTSKVLPMPVWHLFLHKRWVDRIILFLSSFLLAPSPTTLHILNIHKNIQVLWTPYLLQCIILQQCFSS